VAKPNTHVKQDRHSLYVKTGGYLFRPVKHSYLTDPVVTTAEQRTMAKQVTTQTKLVEGEKVYARHIGGSMYGKIEDELWVSHGPYRDQNGKLVKDTEHLYET